MKKTTENKEWRKFERKVSEDINGKLTAGSGNTDFDKGDCKTFDYIFDAKTTEKKSYSIKKELMERYEEISKLEGKNFALAIRFIDKDKYKDYILLDYNTAVELLKEEDE